MQQRLFNRPFKEYLISFSLFFSFILYHSMRNKKKEGLTMEYIVIIPALNPEPCLEKLVDRLWELEIQNGEPDHQKDFSDDYRSRNF